MTMTTETKLIQNFIISNNKNASNYSIITFFVQLNARGALSDHLILLDCIERPGYIL